MGTKAGDAHRTESREEFEDYLLKEYDEGALDVVTRFIETPDKEPVSVQPKKIDPSYDRDRRTNSNWRETTWPYPKKPLPEEEDGDTTHEGVPTRSGKMSLLRYGPDAERVHA